MQIELPGALLERARVQALDEAQELVTLLLEKYVQKLEQSQRLQTYEAYYASRTLEDEVEERELLADFAFADAEGSDETIQGKVETPRPGLANRTLVCDRA
ncbi:MAG: hypothetical protein HYZ50_19690 [Deltaproteobacteria bacterium]|nr:hypothetical protein [Deltaproteobacteria bacterium]